MNNHGHTDDFSTGQFAKFSGVVSQKLYPAIKGRMSGKKMTEFSDGPNGPNKTMLGLRNIFCKEEPSEPIVSLFADQQIESNVGYHPSHRILSPADQIDLLCRYLPELNLDSESGKKHLSDLPDIEGREEGIGVFVKREKFSDDYPNMIWLIGDKIAARENAKGGKFTLYPDENAKLFLPDRKSLAAIKKLSNFYSGDFFFAPIQHGLKYRGHSVDLSNDICERSEFLLPTPESEETVLLHEHLIAPGDYLRMDCGGDFYDFGGYDARCSGSPCFCRDPEGLYLDALWRGDCDPGFGASSGSARAVSL